MLKAYIVICMMELLFKIYNLYMMQLLRSFGANLYCNFD